MEATEGTEDSNNLLLQVFSISIPSVPSVASVPSVSNAHIL